MDKRLFHDNRKLFISAPSQKALVMECFVCEPLLYYSSLGLVINNVEEEKYISHLAQS